jgi:hypothetical protein
MNINLAFAYSSDPLCLAALKEFHIFAVDPGSRVRLNSATVTTTAPALTAPLAVPMTAYGAQMVEVVPIDLQGTEGLRAYAPVYVPLPAASGIAQVVAK